MDGDTRLTHRVYGSPGAARLVVLVGTGIAVATDPAPAETAARSICVLAVSLDGAAIADPGTFGSETPAEQTSAWLVELIRGELAAPQFTAAGPPAAGLIIYREAVDVALRAAASLGDTIDRIALVAVAEPEQPLDRDDLGILISAVSAKALIMNGQREEAAANAAANWYRTQLPSARVEMVPGVAELSLTDVWARALSHVAPRTKR
ncbi:hypothetical protein SAMN04487846_2506 [Microbacterium sp. cf046]|uniref:hypothetical protein n=1 Tax=Microbacterium sp. cf046 TaxID=1761803 RepID=UPI0008EFBD74|nr:hypothetical protein [Microbacterium sp. cf046]SFS09233.1 hypothetical protein SAMN04487846_2506 [Microbacterium sp. cf046]